MTVSQLKKLPQGWTVNIPHCKGDLIVRSDQQSSLYADLPVLPLHVQEFQAQPPAIATPHITLKSMSGR